MAELWVGAPDRAAVAAAADTIDALLRRNPLMRGESRSGAERIFFVPPLVAHFAGDEPNRIVYVRAVARTGLRS